MTFESCGHLNPPRARFCTECGIALPRACSGCGGELPESAKFCPECALPVAPVAAVMPRFASPQSYTPGHLAEKILTSRHLVEGERKHVTVVFADLKDSTALLERDPEDARRILEPVLERMIEAVHRYEGTVNQVMGDGIMALFGAPVAHEDHALRACYAALRMQATVRQYAESVRQHDDLSIQIRVGLNSGEVVVGAIGSDLRMEYTAVGQITHVAARMEQMAAPGAILMSVSTLKLVEGYVDVKALGVRPVKGLSAPIEIYEVTGAGRARSRLHAVAARGLTQFVGREDEVRELTEALDLARAGHGQLVAVVGEAGVGKSRLFWEFIHSPRTDGCLVLESLSVSYGRATAYLPVIEVLKTYFKIEPRDDPRTIRDKVTEKLRGTETSLLADAAAFLSLLDVAPDDAQWQVMDPSQRRERILGACKRLILHETQIHPVVLVFEDLHWIDAETQTLLDRLVDSLPAARLLLLVNYRPEYQHAWSGRTHYTQLRIDPLPPDTAEALLDSLLGADGELDALQQLLIERTEGNPFFLEECVRALVETGVLAGRPGAYRRAKPLESIEVPASVQAVLAARIDRLPQADKRLLQSAAVIGKHLDAALLHVISGMPDDEFRAGLSHLQSAEFLYEHRFLPDVEYTFKHALTHQVAYGSLLHDRRRALHVEIVAAIERLHADRLEEHVEPLAHHAARGEAWEKAVRYARQAGAKAASRSAQHEAVTWFEQALDGLLHLPTDPESVRAAIDVRLALRPSVMSLGRLDQVLQRLQEAEGLARESRDEARLGWILAFLTNYFMVTGDSQRALESGQSAVAIAAEVGDLPLQTVSNHHLGQAFWSLGDFRRAIPFLRANVTTLSGELIRERFNMPGLPSVMSRVFLARCLGEIGELAEALVRAEEALRIAEALDHPFSRVGASYDLGLVYLRKGELDRIVSQLEEALALSRKWNLTFLFPHSASILGYAYVQTGRLQEGVELLEHVAAQGIATNRIIVLAAANVWLGEAYLRVGRVDDAAQVVTRALEACRRSKRRGYEAYALRALGEISADQTSPDLTGAVAHYGDALSLASALGMRPLAAQCQLELGRISRRAGKVDDADTYLRAAMAGFQQLEAPAWVAKVERELSE